jgi:hypothetical protein
VLAIDWNGKNLDDNVNSGVPHQYIVSIIIHFGGHFCDCVTKKVSEIIVPLLQSLSKYKIGYFCHILCFDVLFVKFLKNQGVNKFTFENGKNLDDNVNSGVPHQYIVSILH